MILPKRKPSRLKGFDYSSPGKYFITICVKDRKNWFWSVGANCVRPQQQFSEYGLIVDNEIRKIENIYAGNVKIDKYVIMPNHIHLIIALSCDGRPKVAPTDISRIVKQFKGAVTKKIGKSVWQKLFHDHIIRNEEDYKRIWEYIDTNPIRWKEDCFYIEEGDVKKVQNAKRQQ